MKNLKDSILEKLKVDDIIPDKKFSIDGTLDDIVEFLEENGFEATDDSHNYDGSVDDIFNYNKSKCFLKENKRIWFADTSKEKISKKNPIFLIEISKNLSTSEKIFIVYYCDGNAGDVIINIVDNDKKEFLEELNKRFGWE